MLWKQQETQQVIDTYSKLELTLQEQQNTKFFAKLLTNYIPISEIVMEGLIHFSIQDWEKQHPGFKLIQVAMGPDKLKVALELQALLSKRLKNLIHDESNWSKIERAFKKGMEAFSNDKHISSK